MKSLNYTEPSVLRGIVVAVVALLAALGVVSSDNVDGIAEVWLPVLSFLVPLLQSLWTRLAVWSPKSKDLAVGHARTGLSNGPAV